MIPIHEDQKVNQFLEEEEKEKEIQKIKMLRNNKWKNDFTSLNDVPLSFVDIDYTKAYIRHLHYCDERLGAQIASLANLTFYLWLVREARKHIIEGDFLMWKNETVKRIMKRL